MANSAVQSSVNAPRPRARKLLWVASVGALLLVAALATADLWKPAAKQWKWFVVATNVYQDLLRRTGLKATQIGQFEGPPRTAADVPRALDHVDNTFDGYLRYSKLAPADLRGKRVLEIGPGDNLGVALRFASAGASQVSAIDKFAPLQDTEFHRALYRTLRDRLTPAEQSAFDQSIDLSNGVAPRAPRLKYVYGRGFEEADAFQGDTFDLIVSNAVIQEIYDVDRAFAAMDALLTPGGHLIHKIDFTDYGMFVKHGFHPLEFLTIPEPIYRHMAEAVGSPNRRFINYYREKMAALGYDASLYATFVLGVKKELIPAKLQLVKGVDYGEPTLELIRSIRPRLRPDYRKLPDEDLVVQGIYLVARKPLD